MMGRLPDLAIADRAPPRGGVRFARESPRRRAVTGRARTRLLLLCLGVLGPGLGQTSSDVFPGAFAVRPVKGDCVTTPVTEIAVSRLGVLQS